MTPNEAFALVEDYYRAYQAEGAAAVTEALGLVLEPDFTLESPLVEAQLGGPATGQVAFAAAGVAAPFLAHAVIESLYATPDGSGVVALIRFPSPAGEVVQSEHFDVDPRTSRITRLRSFYDPRKLLALALPPRPQ